MYWSKWYFAKRCRGNFFRKGEITQKWIDSQETINENDEVRSFAGRKWMTLQLWQLQMTEYFSASAAGNARLTRFEQNIEGRTKVSKLAKWIRQHEKPVIERLVRTKCYHWLLHRVRKKRGHVIFNYTTVVSLGGILQFFTFGNRNEYCTIICNLLT